MSGPGAMGEWVRRLRAAAEPALRGTPILDRSASADEIARFIEGFRDELGHRRPVDGALLRVLLGVKPVLVPRERAPGAGRRSPDCELWSVLADGTPWTPPEWLRARGPLASDGMEGAIEVWTETELSCVHALWSIGRRERDTGLRTRCIEAAAWMMDAMQPDNGTNHPWAIHVFAWRWAAECNDEARLYAESMLHNCMISLGRPDRFSACVLWHAAAELECE
ncbi:MAG: hypothetical protein L6Q35_12440 [Phycisphaerales bacterium]|nr:hypothetical protein [Phycisphaerales bacterium]